MSDKLKIVRSAVEASAPGPVLVHSDIFLAMNLIEKVAKADLLLQRHMQAVETITAGRELYFPTFNYDFPKTRTVNAASDVSQVGHLSEYARKNWAVWRDATPIFSFCGLGQPTPTGRQAPAEGSTLSPFDEGSLFHHLYENDGVIIMYGAPFSRFTAIHYIEHRSGGPLYRYDKFFRGSVQPQNEAERTVTLKYHVRPMGANLEYDWQRLEAFSQDHGALAKLTGLGASILVIPVRRICDLWQAELKRQPLFLLDEDTRAFVEPKIDTLGRRFELSDFEA